MRPSNRRRMGSAPSECVTSVLPLAVLARRPVLGLPVLGLPALGLPALGLPALGLPAFEFLE